METIEVVRRFVCLLEDVARGSIGGPEALRSWPNPDSLPRKRVISRGWEALTHFAMDDDIRERDPSYAEYQIRELTASAAAIRKHFGLSNAGEH